MSQKQNDDKIKKTEISSSKNTAHDSSFAENFKNYLYNNKEVKTISWFEYESM